MSDWISVEDKFPPHRAVVIVEGGIAYYDALSGVWISETGSAAGRVIQWEVTHWIHLPQLHKDAQ